MREELNDALNEVALLTRIRNEEKRISSERYMQLSSTKSQLESGVYWKWHLHVYSHNHTYTHTQKHSRTDRHRHAYTDTGTHRHTDTPTHPPAHPTAHVDTRAHTHTTHMCVDVCLGIYVYADL